MSMIFGWNQEEWEWADNYDKFIERIKKDALISYEINGKKEKIYVICPEYISIIRGEYEFWSWDMKDCIREIKGKAEEKGVPYEIIHIDHEKFGDNVSKRKLEKLYKKERGLL